MADLIRHMEEGHETADIDGVIDEVAEARGTYDSLDDRLDAMGDAPSPSSSTPAMDGTGAAGTADTFARGDHVHPTDTSRQAALTTAQLAAVNSGIDSTKVAQIETNKNNISSKIGASNYATQNTGGTVRVWTTTDGTDTILHISNEAPTP